MSLATIFALLPRILGKWQTTCNFLMEGIHPYRTRYLRDSWASKKPIIYNNNLHIERLLWNVYIIKITVSGEPDGQDEALQIIVILLVRKGKFRCALYVSNPVTMLNKISITEIVTIMELRNIYFKKMISSQAFLGFDCYYFHFI